MQVTGAATITSLGTGFNGCRRDVRFSGACTLTNSASIQLPNSANIVTAAGDVLTFRCVAAGQWILTATSRPATAGLAGVTAFMQGVLTSADAATARTALGAQAALGYTPVNKATDTMTGTLAIQTNSDNLVLRNAAVTAQYVITAGSSNHFVIFDTTSGISVLQYHPSEGFVSLRNGAQAFGSTCAYRFEEQDNSAKVWKFYAASDVVRLNRPDLGDRWTLASTGNMSISGIGTGVNWVATSDMRLKDVSGVVEPRDFRALEILEWDWKDGTGSGIGPGAQYVEDIAPQYVTEADGVKRLDKAGVALEWCASLERKLAALEGR